MENLAKFDAAACQRDTLRGGGSIGGGGGSGVVNVASGGGSGGGGGGISMVKTSATTTMTTPPVSAHTGQWLAALHVNNNNNTEKSFNIKDTTHMCGNNLSTSMGVVVSSRAWQCESCDMYQKNGGQTLLSTNTLTRVALIEEDEGGGDVVGGVVSSGGSGITVGVNKFPSSLNNGTASAYASASTSANIVPASTHNDEIPIDVTVAVAAGTVATNFLQPETEYDSYDMCGAVSLSPPLMEDPFDDSEAAAAAAALGGGHSNRTSLNNSTENLSYTSDNFYGDDLILLGEDGDLEAEELSLNSDDCIYAYRGAGADFDLPLPPMVGLAGNFGLHQGNIAQEEETDFLEMDFDPDPPSELEYNHSVDMRVNDSKDQYLMQRDSCHLVTPTQRHQLFSSPIDDLPPAPKALQAQSLLTKNFARITLHLDQIQKDYNDEQDEDEARERLNSALDTRPLEEEFVKDSRAADTSHSLPNTLHEHFTNRCNSESAVISSTSKDGSLAAPLQTLGHAKSPSKITGAKPKRLSTFSSTSSTSSKNSSKSRNSLRSAFQTATLGASSSFDERSVSCSEFRTERDLSGSAAAICKQPSLLSAALHTAPSTAASLVQEFNNFTDETCLDCLEKEFLANTIGKALDPLGCSKCRKRLGHLSLYNNHRSATEHHHHHHHHNHHPSTSKYRRSASPTTTFFFNDQASPTSRLFSCEFLNSQARKRQEWDSFMQEQKETIAVNDGETSDATGDSQAKTTAAAGPAAQIKTTAMVDIRDLNESLKNLETKLFKNLKPPDPCTVTISTNNFTESSSLVQALDKLQIAYNQELLKTYFKKFNNNNNSSSSSSNNNNNFSSSSTNVYKTSSHKEFKNLKEFLLYVSKRQSNYHKLQRLIVKLTQQQIVVQFKKDSSITDMEMVPVRVSDILHYWSQCKNLDCLKDMDKRFQDANILGKIANIIRQAHQRSSSSSRRPLPDFISIPQYYPSGFLTLTKKC